MSVFEDDQKLSPSDAKKKLKRLENQMRQDSCLRALESLSKYENNEILRNALTYYKKNKYLTPRYAFVVFWKLGEGKIDHKPSFFKISLRRDKYKEDLENMQTDRVHLIWPALTSSQRKLAESYGHNPPRT